jgi:type VI secretion system secreted protein VgrG
LAVGTVDHSLQVGGNDELEVYEYPGRYAQRFDGVAPGGGDQASNVQKIYDDNARTAGIRMQQEAAPALAAEGEGNVRQLASGCKFTLNGHFDADGSYVLTRVEHEANLAGSYLQPETDQGGGFLYTNRFRCTPAALPFRPALVTPRPRIDGAQTAVVVGPQGQEIFTDKYGRVKVQFPWDRQGKKDSNSSCWVRVATTWGGKQWGFIQIPRIGQEVVVTYEEGDPDRPLITGSVYNAEQMPPFTLPDNMTQSGTKSRSTTQGEAENFNQLWFEDKKGSELVYFHAEKDFQRVVENNDTLTVGADKKDKGDQTVTVFNNQTLTVGSGEANADDGSQTVTVYKNRTTTITTGDETLDVKQGNRTVNVDQGDDTHSVKTGKREVNVKTGDSTLNVDTGNREVNVKTGNDTLKVSTGNRQVTVTLGNDTLTVNTGNQSTKVSLGSSTTEALQGITLKVGPSSIEITPMGITIKAMQVSVQGQLQTEVKGIMCTVSGEAMLQAKGAITMIG